MHFKELALYLNDVYFNFFFKFCPRVLGDNQLVVKNTTVSRYFGSDKVILIGSGRFRGVKGFFVFLHYLFSYF